MDAQSFNNYTTPTAALRNNGNKKPRYSSPNQRKFLKLRNGDTRKSLRLMPPTHKVPVVQRFKVL